MDWRSQIHGGTGWNRRSHELRAFSKGSLPVALAWEGPQRAVSEFQAKNASSALAASADSSYFDSNCNNACTMLSAYLLATLFMKAGKSTCAVSSARSEMVRTAANGAP